MPTAYFRCECGRETLSAVPMDRSEQVYNERTRRWDFDPTKKVAKLYPNTIMCECGKRISQSADPGRITTKLMFNYFEE